MADELGIDSFPLLQKERDNKGSVADYSNDFIKISRRMKVLEESVSNLRKKILINEENDLIRHKKILSQAKQTLFEINDVKKDIETVKIAVKEIISEIKNSAKKEDVEVLKKYIDMWNPIEFVTESAVEKIIDEKLDK